MKKGEAAPGPCGPPGPAGSAWRPGMQGRQGRGGRGRLGRGLGRARGAGALLWRHSCTRSDGLECGESAETAGNAPAWGAAARPPARWLPSRPNRPKHIPPSHSLSSLPFLPLLAETVWLVLAGALSGMDKGMGCRLATLGACKVPAPPPPPPLTTCLGPPARALRCPSPGALHCCCRYPELGYCCHVSPCAL